MSQSVIHGNRIEDFDTFRLHNSLVASCMAVRTLEGEAVSIAERVCAHVQEWIVNKQEVTAMDIRRVAARHLGKYQPEAAYMYEQEAMLI